MARSVPTVVRRKSEAQELVDSLTGVELDVVRHLRTGGSVFTSTDSPRVTLGPQMGRKKPPQASDYHHIEDAVGALNRLQRAGWLRKASQNPVETLFCWFFTAEADKVFRLVEP
jgi:hypothetical protein